VAGTVLVLNAGSSSVKFRMYALEAERERIVLDGVLDGIGARDTLIEYQIGSEQRQERRGIPTYESAASELRGLVRAACERERVGEPKTFIHRIVHGGGYTAPMLMTSDVLAELVRLKPLAPLHMGPALELHRLLSTESATHIACFDTMFHARMPPVATTYGIPKELAQKYGIRRYGFHGIAYAAMLRKASELVGKSPASLRVVACQLGNGSSVCAIDRGRSVDTSMGFTPLEGLMMGTRSGDIDPAIFPFLCEHDKATPAQVLAMLEHDSGLRGLTGEWDVRKLLAREADGDTGAAAALDLFAYRVRKYIGAYAAVLGGIDLLVLSGGVSRAPRMRARLLRDLQYLGILVDASQLEKKSPVLLTSGRVPAICIEVDEQDEMLLQARELLDRR
jgi:acetate kinase